MRVDSPLGKWALQQNVDLREEFGCEELAQTVAQIHRRVLDAAILAGNYGEAGAIDSYGLPYGLPPAISGINSFGERGYGNPPPETLIVIGAAREQLERVFTVCELAGLTGNRYGVENEESRDQPDLRVPRDAAKLAGVLERGSILWVAGRIPPRLDMAPLIRGAACPNLLLYF